MTRIYNSLIRQPSTPSASAGLPPSHIAALSTDSEAEVLGGAFRLPHVALAESEWLDFDEFWELHGRRRLFNLDQRDLGQWDDMSELMQ